MSPKSPIREGFKSPVAELWESPRALTDGIFFTKSPHTFYVRPPATLLPCHIDSTPQQNFFSSRKTLYSVLSNSFTLSFLSFIHRLDWTTACVSKFWETCLIDPLMALLSSVWLVLLFKLSQGSIVRLKVDLIWTAPPWAAAFVWRHIARLRLLWLAPFSLSRLSSLLTAIDSVMSL